MQIFVKTPPGKTITLDVEAEYTIDNLKWLIQGKEGYPVAAQRLTFGTVEIEDNQKSLMELDINDGDTGELVPLLNSHCLFQCFLFVSLFVFINSFMFHCLFHH